MPLFGKSREKLDFYFLIHNLSPFPNKYKNIYIAWQRGASKEGRTKSVAPASEATGQAWATFQFEEAFHIDCAFTQDAKTGLFEKKWLILALLDGEKPSRGKDPPLGRVVINLADYVAEDDKATMAFTVAANQAISAQVGECKLLVTLGCRSKGKPPMTLGGKLVQPASPKSPQDQGSSMASSEISDDEGELSLKTMLPSAETNRTNSDGRQGSQVMSGMPRLTEAQDPRRSATGAIGGGKAQINRQQALPASQDAPSDADSEDEFLAQAVAAMEGKAPMPSLSPQGSRENPSKVSSGSQTPFRPSGSASVTPNPMPEAGAQAPKTRPLFALKPDGGQQSRLKSPVVRPGNLERTPAAFQDRIDLPKVTRKESNAPPGSPRMSKLTQPVRGAFEPEARPSPGQPGIAASVSRVNPLSTGGGAPQRPPRTDYNGQQGVPKAFEANLLDRKGSKNSDDSLADSQRRSRPSVLSELSKGKTVLSREVSIDSETNPFAEKRSTSRTTEPGEGSSMSPLTLPGGPLQSRPAGSGSKIGASVPPRNNLDQSRRRSDILGSLPPAKAAAPSGGTSRHWLDEPEDLGVETSPPTSPDAPYKAVQPVFLPKRPSSDRFQRPNADERQIGNPPSTSYQSLNTGGSALPLSMPPLSEPATAVAKPFEQMPAVPIQAGPPQATSSSADSTPSRPMSKADSIPYERRSGNLDRPVSLLAPVQKPMERRDRGVSFEAAPTISAPTVNRINPQSPLDPEPRADQRKAAASIQMTPPAIPPISRPEPGFSPESAPSSRGGSQQDARTPQSSQSDPYQLPPTNGRAHSRVGSQADDSKSEADMYARELLSVAALEAAVYLVRTGKPLGTRLGSKARNVHAPARRMARTIISLGPEEGTIFGLRALRAVEAAADAASDISGQSYWWSNCIQLRWMLWAMCDAAGALDEDDPEFDADSQEFDWVMEVLVPPLRELEAQLFQQLFQHMWSSVLMEGATADQLPGALAKQWIIPPSKEEESVQRWIDAFQTAHRALLPASSVVSSGLVSMLKHKMLTALMRRLDACLFEQLLNGWKGRKGSGLERQLPLDQRTLPFVLGGELSFSVGVNLKMAATRWTDWAADIGLRNDKGSPEEGYLLFPKLRATADLLMMPKEVLTDRAIRDEVIPGLSVSTICELLARFRPDELAQEPLQPGLLEALQSETPTSNEGDASPTSLGLTGYEPPSESALLADSLVDPASLEFDNESEDELEALAEMYDPDKQGHTTERFRLLKELWGSAR